MVLPKDRNDREYNKFVEDGSGDICVRALIEGTTGDLLVNGDLTVSGSSNVGVDETVEGQLLLDTDLSSTNTAPALAFGDGDTGFYETSDDNLRVSIGGNARWMFQNSDFGVPSTGYPTIKYEASTATNPVFVPGYGDDDTGIGSAGADQLSLIAGGVEGLRIDANENEVQPFMTLATGPIEFEEDSGAITAMNLPVTSSASDGDEESFSFSIDSNPILKVKGLADGSGGINNEQLQSYGGIIRNTTTVNSASYSLNANDDILLVSYTSTGAVSLTLPSAQCVDGRIIVIKDSGGAAVDNNITIETEGSETIDGSATKVISSNYGSVKLISNGANWFVI